MFKERLREEVKENVSQACQRLKRLNDMIRSAIHNIVRCDKFKRRREDEDDVDAARKKKAKSNEAAVPHQVNDKIALLTSKSLMSNR